MLENRSSVAVILILLNFNAEKLNALSRVENLDRSDLELLSDYELNFLKDFVHRRGKGFVSRVPFDEIIREQTQKLADSDELVNIGGQIDSSIKNSHPQTILNNTQMGKQSLPQKALDFQQLAAILQKLNRKRRLKKLKQLNDINEMDWLKKHKNTMVNAPINVYRIPMSSLPDEPVSGVRLIPIQNPSSTKNKSSIGRFPATHNYSMVPTEEELEEVGKVKNNVSLPNNHNKLNLNDKEQETEIKELTKQLSILLSAIKQQEDLKNPSIFEQPEKPATESVPTSEVHELRSGKAIQNGENNYDFIASITLVLDDNKSIIVDTGLGTDPDVRNLIIDGLKKFGLKPTQVNYVVTTHGHPDHSGNTNDFVNAYHYTSVFQYKNNRFKLSLLFKDETEQLTTNVFLQKTPGHTSDDISVIVRNAKGFGTVVISGDVFMKKEDVVYPMMWKPLSVNVTEQNESRRELICMADSIIPGHGAMFTVTTKMKLGYKCGDSV